MTQDLVEVKAQTLGEVSNHWIVVPASSALALWAHEPSSEPLGIVPELEQGAAAGEVGPE